MSADISAKSEQHVGEQRMYAIAKIVLGTAFFATAAEAYRTFGLDHSAPENKPVGIESSDSLDHVREFGAHNDFSNRLRRFAEAEAKSFIAEDGTIHEKK